MKSSKKIVVCVLCCALLFLFSCSGNNTGNENANNPANADIGGETGDNEGSAEDADATFDRNAVTDNLPEMDFNGYDFTIFTGNLPDYIECLVAPEQNGEVINDAFYLANRTVEDRFNINIKVTEGEDHMAVAQARRIMLSGSDEFDVLFGHDYETGAASLEGFFVNLYSLKHLDFSKPWWPSHTIDSLTFNNKMYVYSNSMTTLGLDWTRLLYINKGMAQDLGLEVPYKDVFDGTWTLDKLTKLTRDIYTDINSDGQKDRDDKYGYIFTGPYYCSIEPFGINVVKKSGDTLEFDFANERTQKVVDMMYDLMVNSQGTFYFRPEEHLSVSMFTQGNGFIIKKHLMDARKTLRASDINYGILPFPKLDENQENYYVGYHDRLFAVPAASENLDRTSVIVEAMSAEGWKKVFPAYYEISMKHKFLADDESIEILDLIYSSRVLDFAYIYGIRYYMMLDALLGDTPNPSTDFSSYYEKNLGPAQRILDNIMVKFAELD